MNSSILFYISIIMCIFLFVFLKTHIHKLSPNTYILDEYYSILSRKYKSRILGPGGTHFTFKSENSIKVYNESNNLLTFDVEGMLLDTTTYKSTIACRINFPRNKTKQELLFRELNYGSAERNLIILEEKIKNYTSALVREKLSFKRYSEIERLKDFADNLKEIFDNISKDFSNIMDLEFVHINAVFDNVNYTKTFDKINLSYNDLLRAGYDSKQINQILKAGESGIILSNINPIVPEKVFRKIREVYNEKNEKLKSCIYKLTVTNTTKEEIDSICNDILAI